MHNVALCYRDGHGVPQDDERAAYWFDRSRLAAVEGTKPPYAIDLAGSPFARYGKEPQGGESPAISTKKGST